MAASNRFALSYHYGRLRGPKGTTAIYSNKLPTVLCKQKLEKPQKELRASKFIPFSKSDFFSPVNGSYSAIGNLGSLNSGKRVGADDNYHWPLKCAHTEEYRRSSLPWSGMQVKTNKITIETESMGIVLLGRPPPDTRFASDIFMYKQGLGGRSAAAHGIDPHRMVHHDAVLVGAPVC